VQESDPVVRHYETVREESRITEGLGQLELLRTQEVAGRFLPSAPARIVDVGGGPGVYAEWLAREGYELRVIDLTPRHVEAVTRELAPLGVTAEIGDARDLRHADNSFDAALLLGPLYHLTERTDRLRALSECARVVRPGGVVVAAAISRFASLFDGLARGFLFDERFKKIAERDLRDGQHRNPTNEPHWFTTAYFHHPDELEAEVREAGLDVLTLIGVEGLAAWLEVPFGTASDRDTILWAARAVETEPTLRGLSPHMLVVGQVSG
jgi:SAM-dependent methyltransferase